MGNSKASPDAYALFEAANVVLRLSTRWSPMKPWAVRVAHRQGSSVQRSRWPERWQTTIHIDQLSVAHPSAMSVVNVHDLFLIR